MATKVPLNRYIFNIKILEVDLGTSLGLARAMDLTLDLTLDLVLDLVLRRILDLSISDLSIL